MTNNDGDSDEARTLGPRQAAACSYRIALGPWASQKVLTVHGAMPKKSGVGGLVGCAFGDQLVARLRSPVLHSTGVAADKHRVKCQHKDGEQLV